MKRTPLKRGTYQLKRSGFKRKTTPKTQKTTPRRRVLREVGITDVATIKTEIQALLREIAIKRDRGCIFRDYRHMLPQQYLECGPTKFGGGLVLQFDHLITRGNSATYGDVRLGVCACKRHHFYFKRQYPLEYMDIALEQIGPERKKLFELSAADKRPHHMVLGDWKLVKIGLEQELKKYA